MALPTFQAAGAKAEANAAAISPAPPAHQADDILMLVVNTSTSSTAPAAPAGWTEFPDSPQVANSGDVNAHRLQAFWRRAVDGSTPAPSIASSTQYIVGQILAFRGCAATGDPFNVTAGDAQTTADTSVEVPGDTTTVAECLIVLLCGIGDDLITFSGWANADLANVTERSEVETALGNDGAFAVATGEKATAGAFGATTATLTTAQPQARISVALKPPPGGGPIIVSLTPALETDTAQPLSVGGTRVTLTPASEADQAQPLSAVKPIRKTITPAFEADTANLLSLIGKSLVPATESDQAQPLSVSKPIRMNLVVATEADLAQALQAVKPIRKDLVVATEADLAVPLSVVKPIRKTLVAVLEADIALPLVAELVAGGVIPAGLIVSDRPKAYLLLMDGLA